jgi:hypothetical protein
MNLRLDAHDLAQLADLMQRAPAIAEDELVTAQTQATLLLQGELTRPPAQGGLPIGAGGAAGLAGSVGTRLEIAGGAVIGWVESSSPHAPHVEFGTKPHWAPVQPLIDWALARLPGVSTEKEARSAAFAVRHKIAKSGTKANPVWQKTYRANLDAVRGLFQAAVARIVARIEAGGAA